jgi:hypothetical protein
MASYFDHKDEYDLVVFYEDIITDAESVCQSLFDLSGTSHKYIPAALEALKSDSQSGTFGKRGDKPKVTEKTLVEVDALLTQYGIPLQTTMSIGEFKKPIC